jgi:hypothetical protein
VVKVRFTLEETTKTQRGSRGTAEAQQRHSRDTAEAQQRHSSVLSESSAIDGGGLGENIKKLYFKNNKRHNL